MRILFFLVFISCLFPAENSKAQKVPEEKPNIIFILTDDQRYDAIGYVGNELSHTPEMDKLAKVGTFFRNAGVTTPICAASRATILSGMYERSHRYDFTTSGIRDDYMRDSYPRVLKENGYKTAFYGKYGVRYNRLDLQFDEYESYDRNNAYKDRRGYYYKTIGKDTVHLTRYTGQQAIDFINTTSTEEPFCLSLSFSAPHAHDSAEEQYFWQEESDKHLSKGDVPGPSLAEERYFEALPEVVRKGFNRLRWTWRYDEPKKYQHSVKGYHRMISGIDREIGKIRRELKKKGLHKNTVIILMGDNGYFLGERQLAGKWLMYDNSVRVPLIVYDPRVKKQNDSEALALNVDVPSTILDLAGVAAPARWQGQSLLPALSGNSSVFDRDTVLIEHLWEFEHIPPSEGIRTKSWKYFRYVNDKSIEELYDLENDPKETVNLALQPQYAEKLAQFRNTTDKLVGKFSDTFSESPSDLAIEWIRNPEGVKILDNKPEFSWVVPHSALSQSAYQILVSSSKEKLSQNIGEVWNSGRVKSSESTNVEYPGKALKKDSSYFWKVRIWDIDNRLSPYSETQNFTKGKLTNKITTANSSLIERINPVLFEKRGDVTFADFGKAAFATLEFEYQATEPDSLIVRVGEMLEGDRLNQNPPEKSHIRYQEVKVAVSPNQEKYQIQIKPDARNTKEGIALPLPEGFPVLMPFRYAEFVNANSSLKANSIAQIAHFSYWENESSHFKSSNEILNQVWDLCKYSIKATTFNGLYVDGDRERIPYEADAYLNQLSHYTTDREYAIARQTIEYFMEHPTWPTEWQQHVALMFYADYMYTGNTELIEKYYEPLKHKTLYELANDEGLITSVGVTPEFMYKLGFKEGYPKPLTDIVDWPSAGWGGDSTNVGERDGYVFKEYNTVINAFYYENMRIMAEFAKVLGKDEEALDFQIRALKAKKAINDKMLDKEKGIYRDGIGTDHASLHANMLPLAYGIVPDEYKSSVLEHIKSRGMACSVYGSQYLMDALYQANEADYALDLLTDMSDRSWYNMIRIGSTITLEAWDLKYKNNLDWNHAWGAVPANAIPRGLWGITPKEPGFAIASIKPQLGNLKHSEIVVPTLRGGVKASYRFVNNRLQVFNIEIPANMSAEFELPMQGNKELVVNGEKVAGGFDTVRLSSGKHEIRLVINSF